MTLLQLLSLVQAYPCVVLLDPKRTCRHHWRGAPFTSRAHLVERFPPSAMILATEVGFAGGQWNKMLALIYMPGGEEETVRQTVRMVEEIDGRAIVLACGCNWKRVPEDVEAMRSTCHGTDVFGVVLQCLTDDPRQRVPYFDRMSLR